MALPLGACSGGRSRSATGESLAEAATCAAAVPPHVSASEEWHPVPEGTSVPVGLCWLTRP